MKGIFTIVATVVVTLILFLESKFYYKGGFDLWLILAEFSGLLGTVIISWNFILAIRTRFLENFFGGLDRVYKIHNILGNLAFVLILNHPLFLIIDSLPVNLVKLYLIPDVTNLPYLYGIAALYVFLILIAVTIFIDIPYAIWKKTHEWMGLVIVLGTLHAATITSDISRFRPLLVWIVAINIIAILAFLYKRYLYYLIRHNNNYVVREVSIDKNHLILTLLPTHNSKPLNFGPGQFGFFSINRDKRNEHPFSILESSSAELKIGAKVIGKFTADLVNLKSGDSLSVNGPYGSFGENVYKRKNMLWISGGIGITPFLSMMKTVNGTQNVTMIHSSRSDDPSRITEEVKHTSFIKNIKFIHHLTDVFGRLNKNIISSYANIGADTYVYLCGPKNFMEQMAGEIAAIGVKKKRIYFEDFSMK